ncbi:MAG: tRNA threonylcarbamoyladenosine dehydratase [Muribaculum sp.]|nr:tRNA threonylcarbamoyladenosine dehydratase [Muribaculum sp.]
MTSPVFNRSELLLGSDTMQRLADARVIIFGVGGVGSWCAESLIRTGLSHLTIVDADKVCPTNINRQMMATSLTVGQPKVEALRHRLLEINPEADITAIHDIYTADNAASFNLDNYDYIVDAIDSLRDKAALILHATSLPHSRLYSSMGAALKIDPTRISVAEFWQVQGCPLAAALRRRFKRDKTFPRRKFKCVFSPELRQNLGTPVDDGAETFTKTATNGSLVHITAIYGFSLAGLIVNDITSSERKPR